MLVLVTRPQSGGDHICHALAEIGHEGLLSPVMEIVCLAPLWPQGAFDALLVTSAQALSCLDPTKLPQALHALPIYGVGARLQPLLAGKGLRGPVEISSRVAELAMRLKAHGLSGKRLLYLAGRDRKPDLEQDLAKEGARVTVIELYEARDLGGLSASALEALKQGRIGAVLHFSRRSAELFMAHARTADLGAEVKRLLHCAISSDAAKPLQGHVDQIRIAQHPDAASLLALLDAGA